MILNLLFAVVGFQAQPPLAGADAALREIRARIARADKPAPMKITGTETAAFRAKLKSLAPAAAADGWVALVREWEAKSAELSPYDNSIRGGWSEIMAALPGPSTWQLIRDRLASRPSEKTRAVVAILDDLLGKDEAVLTYLESKQLSGTDATRADAFMPGSGVSAAELPIALRAGHFDIVAKIYVRQAASDSGFFFDGFPDVVQEFGRKRAEPVLQAMLEAAKQPIMQFKGRETIALAKSIVQSDLAHLKAPQWELAQDLSDFSFLSAQAAKFGTTGLVNFGGSTGGLIYGLGLAATGHVDEAIRFFTTVLFSWDGTPRSLTRDEGQLKKIYSLVTALLSRKTISSLVPLYVHLGRSLGYGKGVAQRLDRFLASPSLDPGTRQSWLNLKASLDASLGTTKLAIAEYEKALAIDVANNRDEGQKSAASLIGISEAVGDLKAISIAARAAPKLGTTGSRLDFFGAYKSVGQIGLAQQACIDSMEDVHNVNTSAEGHGKLLDAYPEAGIELAQLYYDANQPQQIVTLLHEYPKWGADDLFGVLTTRRSQYDWRTASSEPLGFYAAWALAKCGEKPTAVRILHSLIPIDRSVDSAYELLNQIEGQGAMGLYDQLIKAHPFATRPLIWKADLLLRAGKTAEAERTVRVAISLDPVDELAERGRRQTAYVVLARILKAEGKIKESVACERIVRAARLYEQAVRDEDFELHSMAADLYRKALAINPQDCLCLQHYGDVLSALGRASEARAAYTQMFPLVLSSEGASDGADYNRYRERDDATNRQLGLAVFNRLRRTHPRDPGLFVAISQLQASGGDAAGALASLEEAVKFAPRYVRTWDAILDLCAEGYGTPRQAEEATLALIRLAPTSGRSLYSAALQRFSDFPTLWKTYEASVGPLPPSPKGQLYRLEASKRALAAGMHPAMSRYSSDNDSTASAALAGTREVQGLFPN